MFVHFTASLEACNVVGKFGAALLQIILCKALHHPERTQTSFNNVIHSVPLKKFLALQHARADAVPMRFPLFGQNRKAACLGRWRAEQSAIEAVDER